MNKAQLIDDIASKLGGSKQEATNALNAVVDSISAGVKKDGNVQIIGFGTFKTSQRAARMGRNPRTGEAIQIKASTSCRFVPSKALKDSL